MYELKSLYLTDYKTKINSILETAKDYPTLVDPTNKLYKQLENLKKEFETLSQEEKLKFIEDFIKIKDQKVANKNLIPMEKMSLMFIANMTAPFYSSYKAKEIYKEFKKSPNETKKKIGRPYDNATNNCRHFVFGLLADLYNGLINPKNLDWRVNPKTSNPQIFRDETNKYYPTKYNKIVYSKVANLDSIQKDRINQLAKEGDIIWIKRKNGTYHVGILVKEDTNDFFVIDFTGKINKKSIEEFSKNSIQIKLYRISEKQTPT
jgi:hypothetical protein